MRSATFIIEFPVEIHLRPALERYSPDFCWLSRAMGVAGTESSSRVFRRFQRLRNLRPEDVDTLFWMFRHIPLAALQIRTPEVQDETSHYRTLVAMQVSRSVVL